MSSFHDRVILSFIKWREPYRNAISIWLTGYRYHENISGTAQGDIPSKQSRRMFIESCYETKVPYLELESQRNGYI